MTKPSSRTFLFSQYPSQRSISKTYGSLSGLYAFQEIGHVPFESKLEKDFLIRLDTMSNILDVISQPITIPYVTNSGKSSHYTPDYLIRFKPYPFIYRPDVIVEIKPSKKIRTGWKNLKPKFKAAMRVCKKEGMRFNIFNENRIRDQRWQNGVLLSDFKNINTQKAELNIALNKLDEMGVITISEYIKLLNNLGWDRNTALRNIYHLIATKEVTCDISRAINGGTEIWVSEYEQ